jgi:hypothetical protein
MPETYPVFPTLGPADIEVKIKQVTAKGAVALLYKTARTDMAMLDAVVGPLNWQDSYAEIKGNLYCSIGVWNPNTNGWVFKADCGIESREDGEGNEKKGEASDAFKRAGFRWGIGRELYTAPFTFLPLETKANNKGGYELVDRFARFEVGDIGYDDNRRINQLTIVNEKTKENVFTMGKAPSVKKPTPKPAPSSGEKESLPWSLDQRTGKSRKKTLYDIAAGLGYFPDDTAFTKWVLEYLGTLGVPAVDDLTPALYQTMKKDLQGLGNGNS